MAIYHFHAQVMSRGDTRSVVAAAAYRHRAEMTISNEHDHRRFDYREKGEDLVHAEMSLPDVTPQWFRDLIDGRSVSGASEALWNAVEAQETRANGQLAREIVLALPEELSSEDNAVLVRDYVREAFTARGMVADWVIHAKPGNPHVHVMLTMAPMTEDGFGSKWETIRDQNGEPVRKGGKIQYRAWAGDKETLVEWRKLWADVTNRHLQQLGHDIRIDHRSYEQQGIELQPTSKIGVGTKNIDRDAKSVGRPVDLERMADYEASRRENVRRIARRPEIVFDAIAREKSVFDERDIAKVLHRYVDDVGPFQNLMARVMASPEIVRILAEGIEPETGAIVPARFATRQMIALEAEMARRAEHLVSGPHGKTHGPRHGVSDHIRQRTLSRFTQLSDEQRIAIERITNAERLGIVVGRAGAGKTTMMKAAREVWEAGGYRVVGGALAGKAAEGLEKEAGIPSRTLSSWQLSWGRGSDLPDAKTVLVIDEAGMVASRQMAEFVERVSRSGGKLVLVGDADQLQPIEAGAAFRSLANQVGYVELGTIYRQREQWMRDASMDMARGNVESAIRAYQAKGRIARSNLKTEAVARLIDDWNRDYDPSKTTLILGHLRRDVRELNRLARGKLIARGLIDEGYAFHTEDGIRHFAVGEQIVFLKNDRDLGVKNGMLARVVEAGEGRIVAEVGDIGSDQIKRVEFDQSQYGNVDHGYATTIHKSQGATVDRVKVLATLSLDRHLTYVAMTRHREEVTLYYGGLSFEKHGGLIENLSKKGAKDTTLDYAGSSLYAAALQYAESRGLYGLRVTKALIDNQRRWLLEQKAKLQSLSDRLARSVRLLTEGATAMFARTPANVPDMCMVPLEGASLASSNETKTVPETLLKGVQTWDRSVKQEVEEKLQTDAQLTPLWEKIHRRLALVYEKPDDALQAMKMSAISRSDNAVQEVATLTQRIETDATQFGELRGKTGLFASKSDRQARTVAENNIEALSRDIQNYMRVRDIVSKQQTAELEQRRQAAQIDIPALSPAAEGVFARIRDAIDRGDLKAGLAFALADKMVEKELMEVAVALDRRFGPHTFTETKSPTGRDFDAAAAKVAPGDREKLADAWPKLHAVQKVARLKDAKLANEVRVKAQEKNQSKDQGMAR